MQGMALPQTKWLSDLGSMCQVSLAGYAVGGAFLSLSYYDLPYNIMIVTIAAQRLVRAQLGEAKAGAVLPTPATLREG